MTGKEKLCHVVHWLQFFLSFEVLPRHLWNLRHIANNIFYPYPRLERIALNVSAAIPETNEFPCTVHWIVQSFSGVGVTVKSMFHLLIFVIFIGVFGVLIFDFLSRKKTEINGAHVLVRFPVFFFLVANFARFTWQQLACNFVAISLDYWRIKWYWKSGGY